jgi:hypothetical protein
MMTGAGRAWRHGMFIQGTFRELFREYPPYVAAQPGDDRSGRSLEAWNFHSGNIQGTFREHSGNISPI